MPQVKKQRTPRTETPSVGTSQEGCQERFPDEKERIRYRSRMRNVIVEIRRAYLPGEAEKIFNAIRGVHLPFDATFKGRCFVDADGKYHADYWKAFGHVSVQKADEMEGREYDERPKLCIKCHSASFDAREEGSTVPRYHLKWEEVEPLLRGVL